MLSVRGMLTHMQYIEGGHIYYSQAAHTGMFLQVHSSGYDCCSGQNPTEKVCMVRKLLGVNAYG